MPGSRWRSKRMVRTSVTVPFEPTGAAKPQGDRPKSARSTNPQYQCGFRAIREETKHRSRDALHRSPSWAYSIENTGITGERNPFRQAPRVTPSALRSNSAIRASTSRAEADMGCVPGPSVSRAKVHSKVPQKVTPWKNYPVETTLPTGFFARPPVSPCRSQFEPSFCVTRRARANGTGHSHFALTGTPACWTLPGRRSRLRASARTTDAQYRRNAAE